VYLKAGGCPAATGPEMWDERWGCAPWGAAGCLEAQHFSSGFSTTPNWSLVHSRQQEKERECIFF